MSTERCPECKRVHEVCPMCGSSRFTPHEHDDYERSSASVSLDWWLKEAEVGDSLTIVDACWECPYKRERTIVLEHEEVTDG